MTKPAIHQTQDLMPAHPDVQECAGVGHEGQDGLLKPKAYVVLRPGVERTAARGTALQELVAAQLAHFKRPRWVVFIDELPKTATGKIQRFRLREAGLR